MHGASPKITTPNGKSALLESASGKEHFGDTHVLEAGKRVFFSSLLTHVSWVSRNALAKQQQCCELCRKGVELHLKLTQVLHLKVTHLEEPEYGSIGLGFSRFNRLGFLRRALFEPIAIVAGFNDVAVMSQPVE